MMIAFSSLQYCCSHCFCMHGDSSYAIKIPDQSVSNLHIQFPALYELAYLLRQQNCLLNYSNLTKT